MRSLVVRGKSLKSFDTAKRQLHRNGFGWSKQSTAVAASITKDDKRDFMSSFPDIVRDLTNAGKYEDVPEVKNWWTKVLQHNVSSYGKRLRGLTHIYSFKILAADEDLTEDNIKLSHVLGWCLEMMHSFFMMQSDIMSGAKERHGQPSWFRNNEVGMLAVNDALLIENGIFELIKLHFKDKPYYLNLVESFNDAILKTSVGQALDAMAAKGGLNGDLSKFTMDRYNAIVKYKTAHYTFYLPVALAMNMTRVSNPELYRQVRAILLEMGRFFQIQDDFFDAFGDPYRNNSTGTDITEGKCSWLSVVALQRANPEQQRLLTENYGSSDPQKIEEILHLYRQLGLPAIFNAYEEESYKMINTSIQQLSKGMPHDLFFNLLENIYKSIQ